MAAGKPALVSTGVPGEPGSDGPEIYERDDDGIRVIGARGNLDLGAAAEVAASAGRVALVPPVDGPAARLFALTGAAEFLPLQPSRAEAQRLLLGAHGYAGSG
jgi:hypothetical protein